jgi:hypothetical protein
VYYLKGLGCLVDIGRRIKVVAAVGATRILGSEPPFSFPKNAGAHGETEAKRGKGRERAAGSAEGVTGFGGGQELCW